MTNSQDALQVVLPLTKTNQSGESPVDFFHVYANPMKPVICPKTCLGIYLACNPNLDIYIQGIYFPGDSQSSRYSKSLKLILQKMKGICPDDYGTHSLRKGASTHLTSGSTCGPSIVSVALRCVWSLGNVQDRYLRFERAGDQYVGRAICGLPIHDFKFGILPPLFKETVQDNLINQSCSVVFPNLIRIPRFKCILKMCLASLVMHADYLKSINS
jgi:hypothetical protein